MTAPRPSTYDVFRPSALPSASLGQRGAAPVAGLATDDSAVAVRDAEGELKRASEAWNKRIDKEVKAMAGGLKDLVSLADIGENPAPGAHELASFQLQLKTAALVRAAQALRDTAHELRLALVLGDDLGNVVRRDAEALGARAEVDKLRAALAREVGRIVAGVPVGEGEEEEAKAGEAQRKAEVEMKDESVKEPAAAEQSMPAEEKKDEAMDVDDEDEDEFEEV